MTRALSGLLVAVALLFGVRNAWVNWPSYRILSQDRSARDTAASLLAAAPKDSTILSGWHQATPMWYLQTVEGMRPDVRVGYVAPRGAEPIGETWRRRVSESAERQPTIATDRYPEMAGLPFPLAPFHGAFLAQTRPATDLPAEATPVAAETVFGGQFRLRGYTLAPGPRGEHQVNLYWQALAPAGRDYATFVHVVDGAGKVWGQADTTHAAATWQTDRLLADVYRVVLLAETPPGTYRVMAGMYTLRSDGTVEPLSTGAGDAIDLTSVEVRARDTAPVTAHPLWQPFGSGPALIGVDYDTGRSESLRVYLHWRQDSAASFPVRLSAGGKTVAEGTLAGGPGYVTTAYDVPAAAQDLSVEVPGHAAVGPFGAAWRLRTASDGDTGAFLPRPPAGERWLSFGGELALTRADVSPGGPGSQATVDLEFISLRPLTADYSVSVQAPGWGAQSDGTPALGAIPTFKWVRSTRVLDRHRLAIPVGTTGTSPVGVTVYDAFTQEPLGVLDDRAVRAGEGTRVTVGKTEAVMRSP